MGGTLPAERPARPNQASEPQPKRGLGRPVDIAVKGFDAAYQGLIVMEDDLAAIVCGTEMARGVQRRLRDLCDHLNVRALRLRAIIPDQQQLVTEIDGALSARTASR
jgi:hypothetical protein